MSAEEDGLTRLRMWLLAYRRRVLRGAMARGALDELMAQPAVAMPDQSPLCLEEQAPCTTPSSTPHSRHAAPSSDPSKRYMGVFAGLPARYLLHCVTLVLVITITLGETVQSWSLQAALPWRERMSLAVGGGGLDVAPVGDIMPVVLPFDEQSAEGTRAADLVPGLRKPQPVIDAFRTIHQLAPNETLGQLAEQYNVTLDSLIWSNSLENGDVLMVGQELRIPRTSGLPYVIQEADTLDAIATRFGTTVDAILLFEPNKLQPDAPLPAGREIFVPGGVLPLPEKLLSLRGGKEGLAASGPQEAGVVLEPETNMRSGPGQMYERVVQLDAGRRAQLIGRHKKWIKVDIAGTIGWIRGDLLQAPAGLVESLPEITDIPPPPPIWVWPARGSLTSYFGPRWGGFHNGLDIANRAWSPIVAARAGTVFEAGWCSGYGYCVKINHGGGVQTIYGHLIDQPVVEAGDEVAVGQLIGHMGSTYDRRGGGYSTGVHLHFTVMVNGRAVDPLKVLP